MDSESSPSEYSLSTAQNSLVKTIKILLERHSSVTYLQKLIIQTELKRRNVQDLTNEFNRTNKQLENLENRIQSTKSTLTAKQEALDLEKSENECEKFEIKNETRDLLNFHKYEKIPIYRACISRQRQLLNDLYTIFPVNANKNLVLGDNVPELMFNINSEGLVGSASNQSIESGKSSYGSGGNISVNSSTSKIDETIKSQFIGECLVRIITCVNQIINANIRFPVQILPEGGGIVEDIGLNENIWMLNSGKKEKAQFLNKIAMIHCDLFDIAIGSSRLNGLRKGTARNIFKVLEYLLESGYKSSPASLCSSPSRLSLAHDFPSRHPQVSNGILNHSLGRPQMESGQIYNSQQPTVHKFPAHNADNDSHNYEHNYTQNNVQTDVQNNVHNNFQNHIQTSINSNTISSVNTTGFNLSSKSQSRIAQRNKLFGS